MIGWARSLRESGMLSHFDLSRRRFARTRSSREFVESRMNYCPAELSGGEQPGVASARAIVKHPEVSRRDEPTEAKLQDLPRLSPWLRRQASVTGAVITLMQGHACALLRS